MHDLQSGALTDAEPSPVFGPVVDGAHCSPNRWDRFVDAWGGRPGEYFVIGCNFNTGVYTLARTPGGREDCRKGFAALAYPNGTTSPRYYPGDLVRCTS